MNCKSARVQHGTGIAFDEEFVQHAEPKDFLPTHILRLLTMTIQICYGKNALWAREYLTVIMQPS